MWSVKCGVWSVKCGGSVGCKVWSVVRCTVWSVECKFRVWSVECKVWREACKVWSVEWGTFDKTSFCSFPHRHGHFRIITVVLPHSSEKRSNVTKCHACHAKQQDNFFDHLGEDKFLQPPPTHTRQLYCHYRRSHTHTFLIKHVGCHNACHAKRHNNFFDHLGEDKFFPRASERSVLLIVGVCYTSSYLHIFISHLLIFTSRLHIFTSSHLHIFASSHLHIFTSSHIIFSSALHILTSSLSLSCLLALLSFLPSSSFSLLPSCPLSLSLFLLPSCPLSACVWRSLCVKASMCKRASLCKGACVWRKSICV